MNSHLFPTFTTIADLCHVRDESDEDDEGEEPEDEGEQAKKEGEVKSEVKAS